MLWEVKKIIIIERKEKAHKNRRSIFIIDYNNGFKECQDLGPDE